MVHYGSKPPYGAIFTSTGAQPGTEPKYMDAAKQQAIGACGRCGHDERSHEHATGTDLESIAVLTALGGPCAQFTVSGAALRYQKHLAMTARPPRRTGQRAPICHRCGNRGHLKESCPL